MKQLVELALTDDDVIIVEVDATTSGRSPMRGLTQPQVIVERASISFDQALDELKPTASTMISRLPSGAR